MNYEVRIRPSAEKDLKGLPKAVQARVAVALRSLEGNPRPPGMVALKGEPTGNYRLRVGSFRIGYEVDDTAHVVWVWQIGDRRDFYEKAKRRRK